MGTDHQDGEMQQQGSRYGQLVLSAAGQPLRTYWLTQTRTVIGRRATNTLVLDDLTVSGEHAVLMAGQQDVVIQDLGSRNGTLVNGAPVARALLNDGDSIDIGIYRLVYRRAGTIGPTDAHEQGAPSGSAQPPRCVRTRRLVSGRFRFRHLPAAFHGRYGLPAGQAGAGLSTFPDTGGAQPLGLPAAGRSVVLAAVWHSGFTVGRHIPR